MEIDGAQPQQDTPSVPPDAGTQSMSRPSIFITAALKLAVLRALHLVLQLALPPLRDNFREFRDIQVKVHIRRPERDSWVYMGRGLVTQEVTGHSSRVGKPSLSLYLFRTTHPTHPVVRNLSSGKIMAAFNEVRS